MGKNNKNQLHQSPLGKVVGYPSQYDPGLLFPIPRATQRQGLGLRDASIPFFGADIWSAYELSWLNTRGKPQVALAHFTVPCESLNIIESKSLKLYLNSFSQTPFADAEQVKTHLRTDLTEVVWRNPDDPARMPASAVGVTLLPPDAFDREMVQEFDGLSLDRLDIDCTRYTPAPELLRVTKDEAPVSEVLTSRLLKSNCPVTGQPDWASVQISYTGDQIEQGGLLQYLVSLRQHSGFHEQCVERIFMDIWTYCKPLKLTVYARYTRRGGLDINPFRTSHPQRLPPNIRTARQ